MRRAAERREAGPAPEGVTEQRQLAVAEEQGDLVDAESGFRMYCMASARLRLRRISGKVVPSSASRRDSVLGETASARETASIVGSPRGSKPNNALSTNSRKACGGTSRALASSSAKG